MHALALEDVADPRQALRRGIDRRGRRGGMLAVGRQREIEQAMGVVVGRAQHLAARHVLEGRGDAPLGDHAAGVERQVSPKRGRVVR